MIEVGNLVEITYSPYDTKIGRLAVVTALKAKEAEFQSWSEVYIKELDSGQQYSIETDCLKKLCDYADPISKLLWL